MSAYIYCIRENYRYQSSITGQEFENEWFKFAPDGVIIIKGTNRQGYAWDGCSPKFKIKDIYIGILEAVLNFSTGQSKTYYASLIHDVFYQFSKDIRAFIKRKEVDREFYAILKRDDFRFAALYYFSVRLLGWIWWYRRYQEAFMKEVISEIDGLAVRPSGVWIKQKYYYLKRYLDIFSKGMKNRWGGNLTYIDLFAGPGRCLIESINKEEDGSPLIALQYDFKKYVFVEESEELIEALKERSKNSPKFSKQD